MDWKRYLWATLWFNFIGFVAVYGLQRLQDVLPLNPQKMGAVSADSSFNTAVSFATNTNWQGYGGEATMSYLTQMLGLSVQNFVSAATGMAVLIALTRGFARKQAKGIGNFWVDLTRSTLYILLPLSLLLACALVTQGVVQTFQPYKTVDLVQAPLEFEQPKNDADGKPVLDKDGKPVMEKATTKEQTLPLGPAASQIAIKQLGTNGGGFFNVNSAHPYENPTPLVELPRDAVDPRDFRRALLHLRPHDRRHAPGLGAARRDDDRLCRLSCGLRFRGTGGQPILQTGIRPPATWKARKSASGSPIPRSGRRRPPQPRTARSIRCTTPTRRSAAWCRW